MSKRKFLIPLAALSLMFSTLVACNGGGNNGSSKPTETSSQQTGGSSEQQAGGSSQQQGGGSSQQQGGGSSQQQGGGSSQQQGGGSSQQQGGGSSQQQGGSSQQGGDHTHEFGDWAQVKAPTYTELGSEERSCSCGEKEQRDVNTKAFDVDATSEVVKLNSDGKKVMQYTYNNGAAKVAAVAMKQNSGVFKTVAVEGQT